MAATPDDSAKLSSIADIVPLNLISPRKRRAVLTSPLGVNSRIIYFSRIASSRRNSIRRCTGKSGKVEQRGGQR
ncbi:hypothetical protein Droror1_Dr00002706 [Drosera rotundifolia]